MLSLGHNELILGSFLSGVERSDQAVTEFFQFIWIMIPHNILGIVWKVTHEGLDREILSLCIFQQEAYIYIYISGLILGLHPANERWRYFVTTSLIGRAQT